MELKNNKCSPEVKKHLVEMHKEIDFIIAMPCGKEKVKQLEKMVKSYERTLAKGKVLVKEQNDIYVRVINALCKAKKEYFYKKASEDLVFYGLNKFNNFKFGVTDENQIVAICSSWYNAFLNMYHFYIAKATNSLKTNFPGTTLRFYKGVRKTASKIDMSAEDLLERILELIKEM